MGFIFGLIIGAVLYLINDHIREEHFSDGTYWMRHDGISVEDVEDDYEEGD